MTNETNSPFFWLDGHNAIIGASDAGKTWTAKWGVEELLRQRRHTLIWDPLGVWYGLRSSADGKGPGFDILIFGGPNGDVPITPADGAAIAKIVVEQRVSAIVDVSHITNGPDQRRFARDMVRQLRRRREKANFHFVIDEADELVPEKTRDDMAFALQEDMLWIAKKGRSSGWVQTLITQRTADIAKSSLSMSQTIIAHQLISPQDQKPFLDWVRAKGTKAELAEIEGNLASLPQGERYLYSPRAHVLTLEKTPAIVTFDTSRTPPPGERRREPRTLAQLDVSAIAAALAKPPTGEEGAETKPGVVDKSPTTRRLTSELLSCRARIVELERQRDEAEARGRTAGISIGIQRARAAIDALRIAGVVDKPAEPAPPAPKPRAPAGDLPPPAPPVTPRPAVDGSDPSALAPAQQRILDQLAWSAAAFHRQAIRRDVLAIVLETHPRTKGFLNNLGALRSAGLIDYPEPSTIALTSTGVDQAARPALADATLDQLRARVLEWLPPAQARILQNAFFAFPRAIDRDGLADRLGVHPRTKSLLNNIGRLKTLGLLTAPTPAELRAADYLFGKD